jgi:hypothetical protein
MSSSSSWQSKFNHKFEILLFLCHGMLITCKCMHFAKNIMKKKGVLQLIVFIHYECYRTKCKSCNSPSIRYNSLQLNYNFVTTILFQLRCNSLITIIIMSCWHHFSFVHQILTCGTIWSFFMIFLKYWYPPSIMIIRFRWSLIMTCGIIKSCHVAY